MTKEKISLARQVVHTLATATEGLTAKDIAIRIGAKPQATSVAVWKLKIAGTVTHDRATATYKLTDVNTQGIKALKPIVQQAEIVEHQRPMQKLQKQIDELSKGNAEMSKHWRTARDSSLEFERKYFDALAVIAYLEARLAK
jgi:O6-methylguanine-DNA--protein-cysteine methyltransferase